MSLYQIIAQDEVAMRAHMCLCTPEAIQTQLRGSYRNEPIYKKVEEELRKRGIVCGWEQCRDKLKALKKTYKDILDKLRRSGAGVESEDEGLQVDWRYFWPMHRVMGTRSTATPRHLLGLGSRNSPVVSESSREVDYQQEEVDDIQQEENQQPRTVEEKQQPLAVEQSQQLPKDSQQLPTAEEVLQQSPTEQNQQHEDTNQECQQTTEEYQPGLSQRKRRKITVLLRFVHNALSTCHPCNSRRDIARLARSSICRCVSITA